MCFFLFLQAPTRSTSSSVGPASLSLPRGRHYDCHVAAAHPPTIYTIRCCCCWCTHCCDALTHMSLRAVRRVPCHVAALALPWLVGCASPLVTFPLFCSITEIFSVPLKVPEIKLTQGCFRNFQGAQRRRGLPRGKGTRWTPAAATWLAAPRATALVLFPELSFAGSISTDALSLYIYL